MAQSNCTKIVAYVRVSTKRQGQSGLGLEGQTAAVEAYASSMTGRIVGTYTEVETGKRKDRPELLKALAHAKATRARLVIAKLDRLSRNVAFLSALMESGVDFVAVDNPHADRFTIHILAAVAEKEAADISARTKAALAAYKRRGGLLGAQRPECRDNLSDSARRKGRRLGAASATRLADEAYAHVGQLVHDLRASGQTLTAIADTLNRDGYSTRRGRAWNPMQVSRVLDRHNGNGKVT